MIKTATLALLTGLLLLTDQAFAQPEVIVKRSIKQVFQPASTTLASSTAKLANALENGCDDEPARQAFIRTARDFSVVEYYRIGAMNRDNRAERLFFWPDRRGIGERQLRQLLADPERTGLTASALADKSVALQGLPALERILFSSAGSVTAEDCIVAAAIAGNMATIATELSDDWQTDTGVAAALNAPANDSIYRTEAEAMAALLTIVDSGLENLADRKLSLIGAGLDDTAAIVKSAPLWRSEQTLSNLRGNLEGLRALLIDGGLADAASLEADLAFEFQTAHSMLDAADEALDGGDAETARARLAALESIARSLVAVIDESVAPVLGVETGFNSGDGD